MKKTMLLILLFFTIIISINFNSSTIEKRYVPEDSFEKITMTNERYSMYITLKITPLLESVYNLSSQSKLVDSENINSEIDKTNTIIDNIQVFKENLELLTVTDTKEKNKQNLIRELTNLQKELRNYQHLLSGKDFDSKEIQNQIDNCFIALNNVKEYAK